MSNPTMLVESFDGTIGAFAGIDPIRFSAGLWLEEGATNIAANPSAENASISAANGWADFTGTGVLTKSTERYTAGLACAKFVYAGVGVGEGFVGASVSNVGWTGSPDIVKAAVDLSGSGVMDSCRIRVYYTDASTADGTTRSITLGDEWAREEFSVTLNPAKTVNYFQLMLRRGATPAAVTAYADSLQFARGGYVTSYLDGSMGLGYAWSVTAHESTSTRAASSAALSPTGILSPASGAIAVRLTPTIETGLEEIWGECGTKGAGTDHLRWGRDASRHPFVEWSSNDAAYQRLTASETIDAGTETFLYFGHAGTATSLQVDSGTLQTDTRDAVEDDFSTGDLTLQASAGGVIYDDFATFDRTLTATEIAQVRRAGSFSLGMFDGNPYIHFQLRPY